MMQDEDREVVISTVQDDGSPDSKPQATEAEVKGEADQDQEPTDFGAVTTSKPIHPKESQGYRWVEINPADRNFIVEALRLIPIKNVYTGRRIESMVAKIEGKKVRTNLNTPL
jgi:hypothetical protein